MSLDSSLKFSGSLTGHRNVLTRTERIAKLQQLGEFDAESGDPMGLRKIGNRKVVTGKKKKKKTEDAEE